MSNVSEPSAYVKWMNRFFSFGIFLFLAGFFIAPDANAHKSIFYWGILLPFLFGLPLMSKFFRRQLNVLWPPITVVVIFLAPVFWSPDYSLSFLLANSKASLFIIIWIVLVAYYVDKYPNAQIKALRALVFVAFFTALYIIWDRYSPHWNLDRALISDWRYGNQNRMAKCFGFMVFVSLWFYLLSVKIKEKAIYFICAAIFLSVVILSKSTGALGAVVLSLPFLWFVWMKDKFNMVVWLRLLAVLIFLTFLVWYLGLVDIRLEGGWSNRDVIWLAVIDSFMESPLFGTGVLDNERVLAIDGRVYGHEHNIFLAILRQSGLFGGVTFLMSILALIVKAFSCNSLKSRVWLVLFVYGMIASMSGGKYPIGKPSEAWLIVWVSIAFLWANVSLHQGNKNTERAKG